MVKEIMYAEKLCKLQIVVGRWGPERGEQVTERKRVGDGWQWHWGGGWAPQSRAQREDPG